MLVGLLVSGLSTGLGCSLVGVGAVALFIGVAMLAPKLVPPLVRVLGWPAARFGGAAGKLAEGNSARNPARTASTASALMIGLALVTLVAVLAAGLRSRFEGAVKKAFVGNYAITAENNFSPISIASEEAVRTRTRRQRGVRRPRRHGARVRLEHQPHRRRAQRQSGDQGRLGARQPGHACPARVGRRVRQQGLRQGPASAARLAAAGRDAYRPGPASEADRHHQPTQGRLAVRRHHDLPSPVRQPVPEPPEPVHAASRPRAASLRPTPRASALR